MKIKSILSGTLLLLSTCSLSSQDRVWTMQDCIDYAMENNISLKMSRNNYLSGLQDSQRAKAAMFPTLSASASQNVSASAWGEGGTTRYGGSYGLNSALTLYNGGRLKNALKQQEALNMVDSLSLEENRITICTQIVQAYLQCLYAEESVKAAESTAEVSKAQKERAEELLKAGSISKVDLSQLESQYVSDCYQVTTARNSLQNYRLQLKQLLELDILDEMAIAGYEASDNEVFALLPDKVTVYNNALDYMPQVERTEYSTKAAELSLKQAEAGFLPSVSLSAGLGTSNSSGASFISQLGNNLNASGGLTLSVPIFSARENKTAVAKAKIALDNSLLEEKSVEKEILKEVENTYLDAESSQSQYVAALEKQKYAQASYDLTREQFNVGRKNTVELITAQNELTSATQAAIQAKYMTLMSKKLLEIYQGKI